MTGARHTTPTRTPRHAPPVDIDWRGLFAGLLIAPAVIARTYLRRGNA